jgi:hypothetical protein
LKLFQVGSGRWRLTGKIFGNSYGIEIISNEIVSIARIA